MYSAYFKSGNESRAVIASFGGINRRARIADGFGFDQCDAIDVEELEPAPVQ